ncbi:hypothetical protein SERLADRAFT_444442 [Serpula lacrymans var. lacrymans S7.9]|uniref:Uncharacterized protein n=1 Tax=Serpula lacrymans var. lacrymans (strain S7.9) TaxID=578457 RepID=F8NF71_SERL9|nr:uncharacterized protein SERLADRAFT_444442 [Serpula lacrymans var. lacrymans S7.9]EGO30785.1 hypothetical protein SERLADRAFT_444442 [Serpula lacrymans var. lacrymans S7.9]
MLLKEIKFNEGSWSSTKIDKPVTEYSPFQLRLPEPTKVNIHTLRTSQTRPVSPIVFASQTSRRRSPFHMKSIAFAKTIIYVYI